MVTGRKFAYDRRVADRTIDELARDAGTPTSTVRLYQSKGLLAPPRIVGRVGYYDDAHLARLRLIGRLQEQGFSLAAIRHLVDAWETGRGLPEVLGLESVVTEGGPIELTPAQLAQVFEGVELTPEVMAQAVRLGLIEAGGATVRVPNPAYLRLGSEIARLGVPAGEVLDEYEHLRTATAAIADRFVALFERHVLGPAAAQGFDPARVRELTGTFEQLRGLASAIVDEVLRESLAERAATRLAAEADRFAAAAGATKPKPKPKPRRKPATPR